MARLITKNSQTPGAVPSSAALNTGELAVNTADAKLYTEHSDGSVREITPTTVADNGITTAKIANTAVTEAKIADSAVTTNKIANSAVTSAKIADGNVTGAKLENSGVTAGTYTTATVTVDAKGRITAASSGSGGGVTSLNGQTGAITNTNFQAIGSYAAVDTGLNAVFSNGQIANPMGYPGSWRVMGRTASVPDPYGSRNIYLFVRIS